MKSAERICRSEELTAVRERRGEGQMKREAGRLDAILMIALLVSAGTARAQETQAAPTPGQVLIQGDLVAQAQEGPGPVVIQGGVAGAGDAFFADRIELLGFGGGLHGGKVVKGAPFSANATSTTTQTLADGNHITRTTQTNLYRDSQGRFRKEVTLPAIGPLAASGQPHSFIEISDPVAGTAYVLEPDQKVARQLPGPGGMGFRTKFGPGGNALYRNFKESPQAATAKTESLGPQTIEGMNTEWTCTTRTIPVGEIGNEKPITIVSQHWYSADLQMDIKSTHSDPRFGDTTYTLTNIQRTEPAASLFAVPPDYTVTTGKNKMFIHTLNAGPDAPPPPPPPAPPDN
jgi:hypothetical protein